MTHFSEEDLIAYQLHESSDEAAIERHLEACFDCAALSDSIAETLRVFSSEPVPQPDLDRNWQRLRGNLSVLAPPPGRRFFPRFALWSGAGLAAAALLIVVFVGIHLTRDRDHIAALLPAIHRVTHPNTAINGHGPLTTEPVDPTVANHLDAAERLLTEVNHTSGSLDPATRAQAHDLLLSNALYVRTARTHGDLAQAAVLDDLGRVLTTLDNESSSPHSTLQLRLEMNTSGLLLDIRILRQNHDRQ
jgi:predicted anti-sigma-YlaC factor YlaD